MPELRRHVDAAGIAVQLILGERALAALKDKAANPPKKPADTLRKAPRLPGSGSPAKGSGGAVSDGANIVDLWRTINHLA